MNKKLLIVLALLLLAVPLRAQWYVGGSLAFRSSEAGQSTNIVLRPDVGYSWEKWSLGVAFSIEPGSDPLCRVLFLEVRDSFFLRGRRLRIPSKHFPAQFLHELDTLSETLSGNSPYRSLVRTELAGPAGIRHPFQNLFL